MFINQLLISPATNCDSGESVDDSYNIWNLTNAVRFRLAPLSSHSQSEASFLDNPHMCNRWVTPPFRENRCELGFVANWTDAARARARREESVALIPQLRIVANWTEAARARVPSLGPHDQAVPGCV